MSKGPLLRDGKVRVCKKMCKTCIFRPGNKMHLKPGRVEGMVEESLANDSCIPCHNTLDGQHAVCAGFWKRHNTDTLLCRIGHIYGLVEVDPDA